MTPSVILALVHRTDQDDECPRRSLTGLAHRMMVLLTPTKQRRWISRRIVPQRSLDPSISLEFGTQHYVMVCRLLIDARVVGASWVQRVSCRVSLAGMLSCDGMTSILDLA
jgi:hypothetical protein